MNFFRMGTNVKVCFLGGMGKKSLVVSQNKKVRFFIQVMNICIVICWTDHNHFEGEIVSYIDA